MDKEELYVGFRAGYLTFQRKGPLNQDEIRAQFEEWFQAVQELNKLIKKSS